MKGSDGRHAFELLSPSVVLHFLNFNLFPVSKNVGISDNMVLVLCQRAAIHARIITLAAPAGVLHQAGMSNGHGMSTGKALSPATPGTYKRGFWKDLEPHPPVTLISAH